MELIIWQVLSGILLVSLGIGAYFLFKLKKSNTKLDKKILKLYDIDAQAQDDLLNYALSNPNPIIGMNKSGVITFTNHGAESILNEWKSGLNEKVPAEWREIAKQIQLSGVSQTLEFSVSDKHYLISIVPKRDGAASFFAMDITDLKKLETELEDRILFDEQTKLPNRVSFKQTLEKQVEESIKTKTKLGLLIIRLDDYFQVLNTHGEEITKGILLEFCNRLSEFTHKSSSLARLSDNQFAVIEPHMGDPSSMASYAELLIEKCTAAYRVTNQEIYIAVSAGIAFCPGDGETADILSRNAQLAVNRTSKTRNSYEFFQRGMDEQLQLKRELVVDLRTAIAENQFELYYQPQIHLFKNKLTGCEALIRWKHPTKGFISPFYFISAAEESNLIEPIGEWTLREACRQILKWQEQGLDPIKVSVNVSGRQILKTDVVGLVKSIMTEMKITPEWLGLELTESALVQDKDHAQKVMKGLKELGLEIALDDFGTGYSSLSYLMQFPIDKLKIDRSFIVPIENENENYAVTKGIIDLGHSMKLTLIAEGVENNTQLNYLYKHGTEVIQGYLFGKPQPADAFLDFYKKDWKSEISKYFSDEQIKPGPVDETGA